MDDEAQKIINTKPEKLKEAGNMIIQMLMKRHKCSYEEAERMWHENANKLTGQQHPRDLPLNDTSNDQFFKR